MDELRPLVKDLDVATVRANLDAVRTEIAAAAARSGRGGDEVEIVAAGKYLPVAELATLAEAGVTVVGENRAQDLIAKAEVAGQRLAFDFIGHLQSRKVAQLLPHVRLIHSLGSDSALAQLARHAAPTTRVLVECNLSRESSKSGLAPDALEPFLRRCPVEVVGLMTMPPQADDAELSRPYFAQLRELAVHHGLSQLSMGTSQDYVVAVEEGATLVRIGTRLYR